MLLLVIEFQPVVGQHQTCARLNDCSLNSWSLSAVILSTYRKENEMTKWVAEAEAAALALASLDHLCSLPPKHLRTHVTKSHNARPCFDESALVAHKRLAEATLTFTSNIRRLLHKHQTICQVTKTVIIVSVSQLVRVIHNLVAPLDWRQLVLVVIVRVMLEVPMLLPLRARRPNR